MARPRNISSAQAVRYYDHEDYYTKGEGISGAKSRDAVDAAPSQWHGRGARALGLKGAVDPARFQALIRGELPDGHTLHRAGSGRRRAGTDFEFSAPKSFSIQALVASDDRLIAVHQQAVAIARERIEAVTATRVMRDGKSTVETTAKAVIAEFLHTTSRAGDPNLHTHLVALNLTQRRDGEWRSVDNTAMFKEQRLMYDIYLAELARGARRLGYEINRGHSGAPELAHITRRQIEGFSQRSAEVEAALRERGLSRETATPAQKTAATLATRDPKKSYDREALTREWRARGEALSLDRRIPKLHRSGYSPGERSQERRAVRRAERAMAVESVSFALQHLSEREAAFPRADVVGTALKQGMGQVGYRAVQAELVRRERRAEVLRGASDRQVTTPVALAIERRILALEARGRSAVAPLTTRRSLQSHLKSHALTAGQEEAVTLVSQTGNRIVGIQGLAGTGKTTALATIKNIAEVSGHALVGLAPSHSAVKALSAAGIDSQTLARWLEDAQATATLSERSILVLDEAGLVGNQQLAATFERAQQAGSRVVLIGDVKQYEAVEAGRAFAQLIKAGMETAAMHEMLRQRTEGLARAARLSVDNPAAALKHIEVIEIRKGDERYAAIARAYAALPAIERANTLVLTGTNEARYALNFAVRDRLSDQAAISTKSIRVETFQRRDLTRAEQRHIAFYRQGDAVRFERAYKRLGVSVGDVLRVGSVAGQITLMDPSGRSVLFDPVPISARGFTLGTIESRELAVGDRVRITGTEKQSGYKNADRGSLESVTPSSISVRLSTGRLLAINCAKPLPIDYAYAMTGHSAQGLGADTVFLDKDTASRTTDHRSFYTDLTRAKLKAVIYTNDRDALPHAIVRRSEKTSALELRVSDRHLTGRRRLHRGVTLRP
jgi:conjugative relaxase-like TrwC/TraI family protein